MLELHGGAMRIVPEPGREHEVPDPATREGRVALGIETVRDMVEMAEELLAEAGAPPLTRAEVDFLREG